jgi:hypothetical protein
MKPELITAEAQHLAKMTTAEIQALAEVLVKNYPEVADNLINQLGNSFFDITLETF